MSDEEVPDASTEEFFTFLSNSDISLFNYGSGGITLTLALKDGFEKDGFETPYTCVKRKDFMLNAPKISANIKDMRKLLLKILFIERNPPDEYPPESKIIKSEDNRHFFNMMLSHPTNLQEVVDTHKIYISNLDDLNDEVIIQNAVYESTFAENLQPICPKIYFPAILSGVRGADRFVRILRANISNFNFAYIVDLISNLRNYVDIGLIAMEFMDGFENMYRSINANPDNKDVYEIMAVTQLVKLYNLGYKHNDYHCGNILVSPLTENYKYFHEHSGMVIIIDFGRAEYLCKHTDYGDEYNACIAGLQAATLDTVIDANIEHCDYKDTDGSNKLYSFYEWLRNMKGLQRPLYTCGIPNMDDSIDSSASSAKKGGDPTTKEEKIAEYIAFEKNNYWHVPITTITTIKEPKKIGGKRRARTRRKTTKKRPQKSRSQRRKMKTKRRRYKR